MSTRPRSLPWRLALCAAFVVGAAAAPARDGAHVHGVVRLDVALDGPTLSVQLVAPLDALLGFEHRPRTEAQRRAVDTMIRRLQDVPALVRPDPAAQCSVTRARHATDVLSPSAGVGKERDHADVEASFEFACRQPERLAAIELGLFDAFARIERIDVQVAGKTQSRQTLKRPQTRLQLAR
jgi:hypothetical protein